MCHPYSKLSRHFRLAIASAVLVVTSVPSFAQNVEDLSPEDQAKLHALTAFLENLDAFLPTVNKPDPDDMPVTFPYREVQAHVVVEMSVDDSDPLPFMLDTGAPTTVAQEIADAYGGETIVDMAGAAGGNVIIWSPLKEFRSARIGNSLDVSNLTAGIGWDAEAFSCISRNGLLGASTMRNAVWQIDYGKQTVTVAKSINQLGHVDDAIKVPFTYRANTLSPSPIIDLRVGNGTLKVIVDSGGGIPLTFNPKDLASVGVEVPADAPTAANLASGAGGSFEAEFKGLTIPIGIGDRKLMATVLVGDGMAPTTAGNMGHVFLKSFVVTFDWSTDTMYLDPISDDGDITLFADAPSANVGFQGGKLVVTTLAKGGPADKAGLKLGEVVTAIDGVDVTNFSKDDFCRIADDDHSTLTTIGGKTYDARKIVGFFSSK